MFFIKKFLPNWLLKFIRPLYHGTVAKIASVYFRNPSAELIVIGITGTAGKSTTTAMLSHILNFSHLKCGYMTTINFFDGEKDFINKHGLSMPGGWRLQKQLRQILNNGCKYAIVECTSEGLAQNRHLGIRFSGALFTNLSEAHIEAHGSFENYKKAKGRLFQTINNSRLTINGNPTQTFIGVNLDSDHAEYFLGFEANKKFGITFSNNRHHSEEVHPTEESLPSARGILRSSDALGTQDGTALDVYSAKKTNSGFEINNQQFQVKLPGEFNKYNALLAVACTNYLVVDLKTSADAIKSFTGIRGRMEPVENNLGLKIYIDYGCEPASFKAALLAAKEIPHNKIIHVFGSTGGHRDTSKRFYFGKTSAELADEIIIANDDIYDSDPQEIANNIETGVQEYFGNKRVVKHYEIVLDRRTAIKRALQKAVAGDLVLLTGKGSEQFLILPGNKRIEWDEASVVREELNK